MRAKKMVKATGQLYGHPQCTGFGLRVGTATAVGFHRHHDHFATLRVEVTRS